jgi:hypothetical protein
MVVIPVEISCRRGGAALQRLLSGRLPLRRNDAPPALKTGPLGGRSPGQAVAYGEFDLAATHADIGQGAIVELVERADGVAPETLGRPVAGQTGASPGQDAEPSRHRACDAVNACADGSVAGASQLAFNFEGRRPPPRICDLKHQSILLLMMLRRLAAASTWRNI